MTYNFTGKVVIVTGSSSGIGEDAVISFARSGAQVVVTGRNESRANDVALKCKDSSPSGLEPLVVVADISKEEDCVNVIQQTVEKFNRIDVLVNNAGIFIPTNFATDNLLSVYDSIMTTNVRSVLVLTKAAIPQLEKTKGVIVNISSVASQVGGTHSTPYYMSKSALDSLTKCSAVELGPKGIRVVSINPAAIQTPMFERAGISTDQIADMGNLYPVGRIGQVSETSAAILFAASDGASFITGSNIFVDGGLLCQMSGRQPGVGEH